jgi:hypothetical protein
MMKGKKGKNEEEREGLRMHRTEEVVSEKEYKFGVLCS